MRLIKSLSDTAHLVVVAMLVGAGFAAGFWGLSWIVLS